MSIKKQNALTFEWIENPEALGAFCAAARSKSFIAVDTEFHRESTYYPQLGLVQVATDERLACIDPFALSDLTPLANLLFDERITKAMHSGRQDIEIFLLAFDKIVNPLFDTQVAAAILGIGDEIGYGDLVEAICGTRLDKGHTRSDWLRRPLPPAVIRYAAEDVEYLAKIYPVLEQRLVSMGRREWLEEEQVTLCSRATYEVDEKSIWKRMKGSGKLRGATTTVALELALWREERARQSNRPPRFILADEMLIDIARHMPGSVEELGHIGRFGAKLRGGVAEEVIGVVAQHRSATPDKWIRNRDYTPTTPETEILLDTLVAVVKVMAQKLEINAGTIASRKDLMHFIEGRSSSSLLQGWRKRLVGDTLSGFVQGRASLRIDGGVPVLVQD